MADPLSLLHAIGELSSLLAGRSDLAPYLDRLVGLVARHMEADVCSVYLYDERERTLTLRSTHGLNPQMVGRVRLGLGEGLVGLSLLELRPVCEKEAGRHPRFHPIPDLGEEAFEALLAAPIARGVDKLGVLVVQRRAGHPFTDADALALRTAAAHLAGAIENARVLLDLNHAPSHAPASDLAVVRGKAASGGFAHAPAAILRPSSEASPADAPGTLEDFRRATEATARQLEHLQASLCERLPEAASLIFTAHLMMLRDARFTGEMGSRIQRGESAQAAVSHVARHLIGLFAASPHAHMREKANDIEDLAKRLLVNLRRSDGPPEAPRKGRIAIARELYPSDILWLASEGIAGLLLVCGGLTAHVSILARSLGLPLVIADEPALLDLAEGTPILLDAEVGNAYVRPSAEVVSRFTARNEARASLRPAAQTMRDATMTRDGERVRLLANINLLSEVRLALDLKADGIGLYRTEFLFLIRNSAPPEEEMAATYRRLFEAIGDRETTVRTLDLGGDKLAPRAAGHEENPALGLRSTRYLLRHRELFGQQLRALLRAAGGRARLRLLFPMIASLEDFRAARAELELAREALAREGAVLPGKIESGVMIELPAAVELAEPLAREAEFFSIGTNDLVQYTLAVDRGNDRMAAYFQPHHPAVLRLIHRTVAAARAAGRDVSVCGEMAHDPRLIPFLLGCGVRALSVDPRHLPRVQASVLAISTSEAEAEARALLAEHELGAIEHILRRRAPPETDGF